MLFRSPAVVLRWDGLDPDAEPPAEQKPWRKRELDFQLDLGSCGSNLSLRKRHQLCAQFVSGPGRPHVNFIDCHDSAGHIPGVPDESTTLASLAVAWFGHLRSDSFSMVGTAPIALKFTVFAALGLFLFALFVIWLMGHLRYQIRSRDIKIRLFGVRLRRIALSNIDYVTKRRPEGLTEYWWSTMRPSHRTLVIRLKKGWRRNILLTPRNRYIFKADLERAMRRAGNPVSEPPGVPDGAPAVEDS